MYDNRLQEVATPATPYLPPAPQSDLTLRRTPKVRRAKTPGVTAVDNSPEQSNEQTIQRQRRFPKDPVGMGSSLVAQSNLSTPGVQSPLVAPPPVLIPAPVPMPTGRDMTTAMSIKAQEADSTREIMNSTSTQTG